MAILIHEQQTKISGQEILDRSYVYLIGAIAALGGLLFGFDLVIISGAVPFFAKHFQLNALETGWAVGCINLGCAAGALLAGRLSDTVGRKKVLLLCALMFALTGFGTGWASSFPMFIIFRMLSGLAVGTAALVCPMYIAEISPASLRGRMVTFYQLAITLGILLAYFSNYFLLNVGLNNWRWMFTSQAAPALLFFLGLLFVAESPRWLVGKGKLANAEKILQRIGGMSYAITERKAIEQSFSGESDEKFTDLFRKEYRHILFIGILIAIFSQAGGQNSLFSYAPDIFKQAGMTDDSSFLQSVILGLINFIFTFIAIGTVDKLGRKRLLMLGSALLTLDALALATAFYLHLQGLWVLIFVLGFIAIYSASLGPVTWVALSEIFPNRIRANAMAFATLSLWIANFFTTASFPLMKVHFGLPATFTIHAFVCGLYFFFVRSKVPETKGKSLEEIEQALNPR
jgi:sugar porter (SP) family MFS transporter